MPYQLISSRELYENTLSSVTVIITDTQEYYYIVVVWLRMTDHKSINATSYFLFNLAIDIAERK